jgi:superfamily I DNA/RNA helicase
LTIALQPPGTGKTKTIIEAVKLLKVHFEVPHPILVCTYTNVAVDNLVEGLAASGVNPLRVGYGGKVKSSLYEHTLDHKLSVHPLKPHIDKLSKDEERIQKRVTTLSETLKELTLKDGITPNLIERRLRMQKELVWIPSGNVEGGH